MELLLRVGGSFSDRILLQAACAWRAIRSVTIAKCRLPVVGGASSCALFAIAFLLYVDREMLEKGAGESEEFSMDSIVLAGTLADSVLQ